MTSAPLLRFCQIYISSWASFGSLCISGNVSTYLQDLIMLLIILHYSPFNFNMTWFWYLCLLSLFFFDCLAKILSILLPLKRSSFWFHCFFSFAFLFSTSLISVLIFPVSFLFAFDLIFSSLGRSIGYLRHFLFLK